MAEIYLHERKDFPDLLRIIEEETGISAYLVEKDYWLMHVLYGLKKQGYDFNLKGGTSLSKGYRIINRFSEDIDIYIRPDKKLELNESSQSAKHVEKRKLYYDQLAAEIKIPGIISVVRDHEFDDKRYYRSGGIRLNYESFTSPLAGVKEGILLEAGFDTVTPFENLTISSWAYDKAITSKVEVIDNRGIDISCYHPGYSLIEKLQTIIRKFRVEQESGEKNANFMRQYYDVSCLLDNQRVLEFIGTKEYEEHKKLRIKGKDAEVPISENQALLLSDINIRNEFAERYKQTSALYYKGQPSFENILNKIQEFITRL
ncbi:MAG: nucleotidyl transferase AbiEii/AbiGii toxin family protein [Bacteroidetes bacterium]|nr:nucleotidyl transferase AbiEii/AbiGii toxin family protein [Bacteroidota bacterium]